MSDERGLPVIVDEGVGDGDVVSRVGKINGPIIVVLVVISVGGDVDVVKPDVGRLLDGQGIAVLRKDLGDVQIADNDVTDILDDDTEAGELDGGRLSNDRGVSSDFDSRGGSGDRSTEEDNLFGITTHGSSELGVGRDSSGRSARTSRGTAI